ncbi:imidazole glycerol phosphate synthase subunit HisH [Alteromonas sp. a30]|uniref:imidazole glycerol phosphate synthase subunit HisH n=1 Tax=Alteromonas sp. a30 TaxID=2730917 RepID=UPI00227FD107|nr:imidazole glycerol phosphate synthase subunit HisH [Alteromonas sp. a30]MCY7295479.1 imidazole glycerol phosphate synthase subunit HisH [Alteromonas sp. a30]
MVDTACANISSLKFAVERLGYDVLVTDDTKRIAQADKVLLPGVGSAAAAMTQIRAKGLVECLQNLQQPVLGICLGMQLMTQRSEEANAKGETVDCLGLVKTEVNAMQSDTLRLPHMGWNQVSAVKDSPLFYGIEANTYFYFVHGYCVPQGEHTLATCEYTKTFSAAIENGNFMGVQFHPERSGEAGAQLLRNFVERV